MGSQGTLVEQLQRTLNQRLEPSPSLAVDGDYGPNTEKAVLRYQQERGLATTGAVGPDMWSSLGVLEAEEAVPDPAEVNAADLAKSPPDRLQGPPYVTARAWGIFDGDSAKLLDGAQADERREMASTTKIMTAYVVLQMVADDPRLRQEAVTFSRRADQTIGSSCGVREGEQLPVDELMYGLLLPSGNDASVALAEHFGAKLPAASDCAPWADGKIRTLYPRHEPGRDGSGASAIALCQSAWAAGSRTLCDCSRLGSLGLARVAKSRLLSVCEHTPAWMYGARTGRLPAKSALEKHKSPVGDRRIRWHQNRDHQWGGRLPGGPRAPRW